MSVKLGEALYSWLYGAFRASKSSLPIDAIERIKDLSQQLAKNLKSEVLAETISLLKKLQIAVGEGFKEIARDTSVLHDKIEELEHRVAALESISKT